MKTVLLCVSIVIGIAAMTIWACCKIAGESEEEGMNPRRVGSNDFCSYGERKDGDGNG